MSPILAIIVIPLLLGALTFAFPRRLAPVLGMAGTIVMAWLALRIFQHHPPDLSWHQWRVLTVDQLSALMLLGMGIMALLIAVYALAAIRAQHGRRLFWGCWLLTLGLAAGAVMADCVAGSYPGAFLLIICWGGVGLTLYFLTGTGRGAAAQDAAMKAMAIVGGSDALMILGLMICLRLGAFPIVPNSPVAIAAFVLLVLAALAKSGAGLLHTWVPDVAAAAPVPVSALLPAALDKMLGIYLLVRICTRLFALGTVPWLQTLLLAVGAVTIVVAVMMALVQHNIYRLLGYHAVSQVGYMIIGIAIGTRLAIAAGLFHLLNHVLYKSCLFLTAGSVEEETGTVDLDRMGGLARMLPLTFTAFVIAALAISGVPPLNGFVSKWMIYQAIVEFGRAGHALWPLWLAAAMFGSALTLASFIKVLHAVFLGRPAQAREGHYAEPSPLRWLPALIIAGLCVFFGVAAWSFPLPRLLDYPADLARLAGQPVLGALLQPGLATLLLLGALALGLLLYRLGSGFRTRVDIAYLGGEVHDEMRLSGTEFYRTVETERPFDTLFGLARHGWFDLYEVAGRLLAYSGRLLRIAHAGLLQLYMTWMVVGLAIIIAILVGMR